MNSWAAAGQLGGWIVFGLLVLAGIALAVVIVVVLISIVRSILQNRRPARIRTLRAVDPDPDSTEPEAGA